MPHAVTSAAPGLQAVILCGPGNSFSTFMGNSDENPKALLPIANRPMVWYPIDFCYRMGITDITLICPPSAAAAITEALNTNPILTNLPSPKPDLLAPKELDQNTGTAEIFRLPEIKTLIKSDFVVLPCDLLCELGGDKLLQTWMVEAASLSDLLSPKTSSHSGGLGVWYETKTAVPFVKKEETDFLGITTLGKTLTSVPKASLTRHVSKIVYSMPKDSVNDIIDEKEGFPLRSLLGDERSRIRLLTGHRDAHIYIFPQWVLQFIDENPSLDTLGEDVIGLWAKATWQKGLAEKLKLLHILARSAEIADDEPSHTPSDDEIVDQGKSFTNRATVQPKAAERDVSTFKERGVPPVLAYVHPAKSEQLVRRVDTPALLLALSLQLAKLSPIEEVGVESASPFAHQRKVAYPEGVKPRTTITRQDCLIAENVTVDEKSSIKESVVGVNCQIQEGAKLHQCLLMEGVVVGKGCKLTRCILGKRCVIGEGSTLTDVEVQENLLVEPRTEEAKAQLTKGLVGSGEDMDDDLLSGDGDDNAGADMAAAE